MGLLSDIKILEDYKSQCSWIQSYGFVSSRIREVEAQTVAEVGVAYGYHAEHLLQEFPHIQYYGLDPYASGYDPTDGLDKDVQNLYGGESTPAMDRLFRVVQSKLAVMYNGRGTLLRMPGENASKVFAPKYFDVAYVDGDHTYEGVLRDLKAWYPLVRSGGILCGDDYDWAGVKQAVTEFFQGKEEKIESPHYQKWYVKVT